MAQPARIDIKEKVQSVREVVPGHSNNEITLVLQYYDYSVEHAIQAYLEDGAKEALQEWHFPSNKDKEKKKKLKKKKAKEQKDRETSEAEEAIKSAVAVENVVLNGDILSNEIDLSQANSKAPLNVDLLAPPSGATSLPGAPAAPTSKTNPSGLTSSTSALEANSHNETSDIKVTATSSHEALPQRGKGGGNRDRGTKAKATVTSSSGPPAANSTSQNASTLESSKSTSKSVTTPSVVVSAPSSSASTLSRSSPSITVAPSSQKESPSQSSAASHSKPPDASSSGTVTSTGTAVRPTSQQKYQTRPKAHDGSKGRMTNDRGTSSSSTTKDKPAPTMHLNTKRPFAGLEKSVKDLHRQTLALTRIKLMSADEFERCYKNISTVFEDLHTAMNEREADIIYEMDKVKDETNKVLAERQKRAVELKKCTDRAASMSENEVNELRHDIKVFVSDRKIDEELGSTHRFHCAVEELTRSIRNFGQVIGVRSAYGQRRKSVSSVSSSCVSHDDLMSSSTPVTPMTPMTPATHGLSINAANPPLPRVVPTKLEDLKETPNPEPVKNDACAKQIEEMQQKFQAAFKAPPGAKRVHSANSSTGVSSMASGSLPETPLSTDGSVKSLSTSVASSTTASPQSPGSVTGDFDSSKKSRSARRRQMQKERDRKYRNEYNQDQGQKSTQSGDSAAQEKDKSIEKSSEEQKRQQEKASSTIPSGGKQSDKAPKESGASGPKPQNESRSQSQPGRRFDGRRDRSGSARGRLQHSGYNRGSSPSKRGGSNQRFHRGGYQGGSRQGVPSNQGQQEQRNNNLRGPKPESHPPFRGQNRDRHCGQGYQQTRYNDRFSKPSTKDSYTRNNNTKVNNNQIVNNVKVSGDYRNSPKDTQHARDNVNKEAESLPRKELETVPENKKENIAVNGKMETIAENKVEKNNNIEKKPSVPPQSNGPKSVNSNHKNEKSNSTHNHKIDENSNHRKSSATVRLTNNGNVPHEVSINGAPIVKKSVVSVEEVTRQQEMGLPQRKPRLREIKRAEVIVNGDLNGIVNGHVEE